MTAIVGLRSAGSVFIGADSCGSDGSIRAAYLNPKLVEKQVNTDGATQKLVLGYTSSWRFGQVLAHHLAPPSDFASEPIGYLVESLVPEIRKVLAAAGWLKKDSAREESGTALIGYRGQLFALHSDFSVLATERWDACGSGREFALGSLFTSDRITDWTPLSPALRVQVALQAAAEFAPGVMPPFHIHQVTP